MAALNAAAFGQFLENVGDEAAAMIIDDYMGDSDRLLGELRDAVAGKDLASAQRAAHTLKSTALLMGAENAAEDLASLEHMCSDGAAISAIKKQSTAATRSLAAARKALVKERKKLTG